MRTIALLVGAALPFTASCSLESKAVAPAGNWFQCGIAGATYLAGKTKIYRYDETTETLSAMPVWDEKLRRGTWFDDKQITIVEDFPDITHSGLKPVKTTEIDRVRAWEVTRIFFEKGKPPMVTSGNCKVVEAKPIDGKQPQF